MAEDLTFSSEGLTFEVEFVPTPNVRWADVCKMCAFERSIKLCSDAPECVREDNGYFSIIKVTKCQ